MWKWRKAGLLLAVAGMSFLLGGCAGQTEKEEKNVAMGRYLEDEISLPGENLEILNTELLDNGNLRIAVMDDEDERLHIWDSKDMGKKWTEDTDVTKNMPVIDRDSQWVSAVALEPAGRIAWCVIDFTEDETEMFVYVADTDGSITDLSGKVAAPEQSPQLSRMEFTEDGNLMVQGLISQLTLYHSQTGERLQDFTDGYTVTFALLKDILFTICDEQVQLFAWENGKALDMDEVLNEQITADQRNLEVTSSSSAPVAAAPGVEDGSLFFCTREGIFSHVIGGSITEKVVDGALCSISSSSVGFRKMVAGPDGDFYLAVVDDAVYKLLHYTYSADTPTVPATTIKLYSLWEDSTLRQVIPAFQKQYPDIFVEYEVGMSGEDGMTITDALKNLNTEMMAGKGPDVLMFDGISADTYKERGLLADISDVIAAVDEKEGLLENIRCAYEDKDGTYLICSRIGIPVMLGEKNALEGVSDITALADKAAALRESSPDVPFFSSFLSPGRMADIWARDAATLCLDTEGNLDETALCEFFTQLKRLWDLGDYTPPQEAEEESVQQLLQNMPEVDPLIIYGNYAQTSYGALRSPFVYKELCQVVEDSQKEMYLWNMGGRSCFIPLQTLGVCSKTGHLEESKVLLQYLLSKDAQAIDSYSSFAINKAVLDEETYWNKPGSEYITAGTTISDSNGVIMDIIMEIGPIPKERISKLRALLETPTIACCPNALVLESIIEEEVACLQEKVTPEEAAQNVNRRVALLLAE